MRGDTPRVHSAGKRRTTPGTRRISSSGDGGSGRTSRAGSRRPESPPPFSSGASPARFGIGEGAAVDSVKAELAEIVVERDQLRALYDQLVGESSTESFDSRRLHILKSQNMQLERQVLLQADALDSRAASVAYLENAALEMKGIVDGWEEKRRAEAEGTGESIS